MNVTCPHCRAQLDIPANEAGSPTLCRVCGGKFQAPLPSAAPVGGGYAPGDPVREFAGKKLAAGICAILLGSFGIHKFILGYTNAGVIMLAVTLITATIGPCLLFVPWIATVAMQVIGIIEGIIYLTKTDEDFYQTYGVQRREWF